MIRRVLLLATLILLPLYSLAADEKPMDTIKEVNRRARLAMFKAQEERDQGKYEKATEMLEEFIVEHPDLDHYLLRFSLGSNYTLLGQHDKALIQYQKCVALEPRYSQGWLNLGEAAYSMEQYGWAADAIVHGYETAETKSPKLLYYAAASYILDGKAEEAKPLLVELLYSEDFDHLELDWYRAMISASLQTEDKPAAERAVAAMLSSFADDPEAWTLAFQVAASHNDYRQASVALIITGYLRPLTEQERMQLGDLLSAVEIPALASRHYEEALADGGKPEQFERLVSAYLAAFDSEKALATLERALELEPTSRLWSLKGDLHYMEEQFQEAIDAFESSLSLDPEQGRARLMQAYCAIELKDYSIARAHLNRAMKFEDQKDTALGILGQLDKMEQK